MKSKVLSKLFLTFLILTVLFVGIFFLMKNLSYFDISIVTVSYNNVVSEISIEAEEVVKTLKGKNIFDFSKRDIERKISETSCVQSVNVRKIYPSEISVEINYNEYTSRVINEKGDKCFVANELGLHEVSDDLFRKYDSIKVVQLSSDYIYTLQKWGLDQGFIQMLNLASYINQNILIIGINYDNIKGNDFGRMNLSIPSLSTTLSIREPVTVSTLEKAMEIIQATKQEKLSRSYDLYSSGLFGRS